MMTNKRKNRIFVMELSKDKMRIKMKEMEHDAGFITYRAT